MAKAYIQLYYDFIEATEGLSDEECGRLVRAMVEYGRSGVIPEAARVGSMRFIFPTFRLQIDRDNRAYEARVLQNTVNGRKGGRPRLDSPATDKLVPYNFKLKESELEAVRRLAEDNTRTIRSLMSEAIADLLRKYGESPEEK